MVRWVRPNAADTGLRGRLAADLERNMSARPESGHVYATTLRALRDGEDVILPGWRLARYKVAAVRRGAHAYYLIDSDGSVSEINRDTLKTTYGWDLA